MGWVVSVGSEGVSPDSLRVSPDLVGGVPGFSAVRAPLRAGLE